MQERIKSNKYIEVSLLLTTVGTLLSIQKPDYYLDIIILSTAVILAIKGYYKK